MNRIWIGVLVSAVLGGPAFAIGSECAYVMLASSFTYLTAEIRLTPAGCRLDDLDPSEPD